jgi:hypothetical protein
MPIDSHLPQARSVLIGPYLSVGVEEGESGFYEEGAHVIATNEIRLDVQLGRNLCEHLIK